jgi:hypothetical protein
MQLVKARRLRPVPAPPPPAGTGQCRVGAHVVLEGSQETKVEAAAALAGPGRSFIAIKIGNVVIFVEDQAALDSAVNAWLRAEQLGEEVFT